MSPSKNTTPPTKSINQPLNQGLLSAEEQKELQQHLSSKETNNLAFLHAASMHSESTLNELKEALKQCETEEKATIVAMIKKQLDPKFSSWVDNIAYNTPISNEGPVNEELRKVLIDGYDKALAEANKSILATKASESTGRTPLHYVALHNDLAKAETLIEGHADLNIKDSRGNTPLHTAALGFEHTLQRANGDLSGAIKLHAPVMGLLIKSGSDVSIENDAGKTAFQMVKEASASVSKNGLTKVSPSSEALIQAYEDHKKEKALAPDPKVQTLDTVKSNKTGQWVKKEEERKGQKAEDKKFDRAELDKMVKKLETEYKEMDDAVKKVRKHAAEQDKLNKKPSKHKSGGCIVM